MRQFYLIFGTLFFQCFLIEGRIEIITILIEMNAVLNKDVFSQKFGVIIQIQEENIRLALGKTFYDPVITLLLGGLESILIPGRMGAHPDRS